MSVENEQSMQIARNRIAREAAERTGTLNRIAAFEHHVNDMLCDICDIYQPRDFDAYVGGMIEELKNES